MRRPWLLCAVLFWSSAAVAQPTVPDRVLFAPGVPESLAQERAGRVSGLRYHVSFTVPAARTDRIPGRAVVDFELTDVAAPLALDFEPNQAGALRSVTANGTPTPASLSRGHIVVPSAVLRRGHNRVEIDFEAGDAPLNRSDDFLYTIFVPARAHEAFPCFDQPDLKARWTLELDVPEGWTSVANGAETASTTRNGRTRLTYAETAPISTYLFAFATGRFSIEESTRNGRVLRVLHRETDAAKVARNRDAIFDLHRAALAWMEEYTGIPYPFGKFDLVLVPSFQFGGMEHPGAIFYNAAGLMLDESATQNQYLERASTIAHETAHMWFGDLVTMRWFTDVWMKEVFANFMAAKIVNPSFPGINHELRFLHAHYPAAYDVDRTAGTNAIRQPLDNLKNAGTLYGAIIYQKAPIVMRQLEMMLGDAPFREGLRTYLRTHTFGNATWPDLIAVLDAQTPEDLAGWSRAWVEERGRPIITTDLRLAGDRIESLTLATTDPYPSRGLTWTEQMQVALGYADRIDLLPVRLQGTRTTVAAARGRLAPLFVLPNGGGLAYGDFRLDPRSRNWLLQHLHEIPDPLTRGSAWVSLWDAQLNGDVPAGQLIDLALVALPQEPDELNVQRILGYLGQAFWKFTAEPERLRRAPAVETALRAGLDRAPTQSLKGTYFASLRSTARTQTTIDWLTRVWSGSEPIAGLALAEPDFIALAQDLAVREVPEWRRILEQQVGRTQNPDRKARLQFITPALSADPAERERWFAALADVANRRREAWVLDGLRSLHHPLRAGVSERLLRRSLEQLEDIQQTGDIFFPTRWMDASLSGHRSAAAAASVRAFLDSRPPDYPERLRRIILTSADDLFRASGAAAPIGGARRRE